MTQSRDETTEPAESAQELKPDELAQVSGGLNGLLLPAVQKVREAAARVPSGASGLDPGSTKFIKQ